MFTTRQDGDTRKKTFSDTVFGEQVHGNRIAVSHAHDVGKIIPRVDGLVSRDCVRLAIRTADCVPILAWDEKHCVIGAAHAGTRGTMLRIAQNLIVAMEKLGAQAQDIHIILGPHVGLCCYNVPEDRAKKFSTNVTHYDGISWFIDIGKENRAQCIEVGIVPKNITVSSECTACNTKKYFSFRKDSKKSYGEQMGVIWIGKN
jgi:YfiH family protein